jgi:hypothetical protein
MSLKRLSRVLRRRDIRGMAGESQGTDCHLTAIQQRVNERVLGVHVSEGNADCRSDGY